METLNRVDIPESERWDLTTLFPNAESWSAELEAIRARLPELEAPRGTLGDSPQALLAVLELEDQLDERLGRLFAYAMLNRDLDTRDSESAQRYEQVMALATVFGRAASWIAPELLTLSDEQLLSYVDQEPGLEPFRRAIEKVIRNRPHVRSAEVEEVLADATEIARTAGSAFTFLDNADITFGTVTDSEGNAVELTKGRYRRFLESPDRRLRQESYVTLHKPYLEHRNTIGALLTGSVQRDAFFARSRHYDSTLEAKLQPEAIPTEVYSNLIATVRRYLPLIHRYIALRKRVLGIDDLHTYDLYVPLIEMPERSYSYDEARSTVLHALQPLGDRYGETLSSGLYNRWSDVYETPGKRSGAYSMGVYGAHPFMLLNWSSTLNDVFTLAHEIGHAMHSWFSSSTQPHPTYQYTIFVAEVASTFNEQLLNAHLIEQTDDPRQRAYLINDALETIRTTIFRQTMFAEFELLVHEVAERGEGLTADRMTNEYARLVADYHGPDLNVDEQVSVEWSRIPHFYGAYYVYQYATGLIAAMALASAVQGGDAAAQQRYLNFLSAGSSKDSLDLLRDAGVDLTTAAPYEAAFARMSDYLDELEELI